MPSLLFFTAFLTGGFERKWQKKFIMEVKTVKTRKSAKWGRNSSKSTSIGDQLGLEVRFFKNSKTRNKLQALSYVIVFEFF